MALAKSMPRLLGIWPEKWETRDIYFRRMPSYVDGISGSKEIVRLLGGYQVSFSKPLLRPVFTPDHSISDGPTPMKPSSMIYHSYDQHLSYLGMALLELGIHRCTEHSWVSDDLENLLAPDYENLIQIVGLNIDTEYADVLRFCISDIERPMHHENLHHSIETSVISGIKMALNYCNQTTLEDYLDLGSHHFWRKSGLGSTK
jgi:nicotinamidase-related amidase